MNSAPFTELLAAIIDNRGRTAPTAPVGMPLIATNCIKDDALYPVFEKVRYVDELTYRTWFRGHPQPGDILFVCKGSPGRVALAPNPVSFCIAQDMVAVRPDSAKVYPKFLFAALRSSIVRKQIDSMHVGTLIPHFKKGDFDKLMIPLVSEWDQRYIGDLYYDFSLKIESNRRAIDLMEQIGASLVADAIGADPDLGCVLDDYLTVLEIGQRPRGGATSEGTVSLGAENVGSAGVGELASFKRVPDEFAQSMKRGHLSDGDVLIYKDGAGLTSGASIVTAFGYGFPVDAAVINEHVYRARGNAVITQALLYWLLRSPLIDSEIRKRATGAAQPGLNSTNLKSVPIPAFDKEIVDELDAALTPMFVRMLALGGENRQVAAVRDALLPELLSGRIRVPEAAAAVGATA